ncbi:hypothetical protein E2C01_051086 [Portunus trituberculatus]|uniref:Uncharacterized protein n=1 Tax=Portunus trituberculatus TaxID=210409 RepID=A0A5B7GDU4_PORTR|nr:hypothetical protein [Portunus trituberculatus]
MGVRASGRGGREWLQEGLEEERHGDRSGGPIPSSPGCLSQGRGFGAEININSWAAVLHTVPMSCSFRAGVCRADVLAWRGGMGRGAGH